MAEEVVAVFDANYLILEDVSKSCALFVTRNRIVVGIIEGISFKSGIAVVIPAVLAFAGLFLRSMILFLAGLVAVIVVGLLLGLINLAVRNQKKNLVKRLDPEDVLKINPRNFELPYSVLTKVRHTSFEKYEGSTRFFMPTFPELTHDIEFTTSQGRHIFVLDGNDCERCLQLLSEFVSEKIERNESEGF